MTDHRQKPCGEHHPLPCGLDEACPVPVAYYEAYADNRTAVEAYRRDRNR